VTTPSEAEAVTESTEISEPTEQTEAPVDTDEAGPSSYTSESTAAPEAAPRRPAVTGPAGATGRRKEAIARVRIAPGTGQWKINGRTLDSYFPNKVHQQIVTEPFVTLEVDGQYDVIARITGGGVSGQAGALRLGIARALTEVTLENRPSLKKAGFLTRDSRVKERKKYGLKKARKAPQYSKR
jgi:small subunit ribosomal protein S9